MHEKKRKREREGGTNTPDADRNTSLKSGQREKEDENEDSRESLERRDSEPTTRKQERVSRGRIEERIVGGFLLFLPSARKQKCKMEERKRYRERKRGGERSSGLIERALISTGCIISLFSVRTAETKVFSQKFLPFVSRKGQHTRSRP